MNNTNLNAPFTYTSTVYPLPTVTYTPESLRGSFVPLNSSYVSSYYGLSGK